MSEMKIDILTLFPDTVHAVLHESILGRAVKKGAVEINCVQIRGHHVLQAACEKLPGARDGRGA